MATAILVDGAFFIKRFRNLEPHNAYNATRAAECIFRWALAHLSSRNSPRRELYRVFFYDCAPLEKKMHNPITRRSVDFSKSSEAIFRNELHKLLRTKRKLALRLGHLSTDVSWTIKPSKIAALLNKEISIDDLTEQDVQVNVRQKGVDMRIGVDVASLSFKKQVDQIVLIAGDADFVPAAKMARREGIDFILDPMWRSIPESLNEHVDGVRSTCPRPKKSGLAALMIPAAEAASDAVPS